jgi:hypothetical protein
MGNPPRHTAFDTDILIVGAGLRPDGYVAYDAHNVDAALVLQSVGSLLERQTAGPDRAAA